MRGNAIFDAAHPFYALMNLYQIRYFLCLAEKLHFWRAAEQLNLTQSALSRHMQSLERELGFSLFDRSQRAVQLTAAGRLLQAEWPRLLTELEAVQRQARQLSRGEVGQLRIGHIGAVAYGWLPRVLAGFTARYPQVQLELIEVVATESEQRLLTYQVDLSLRREPAQSPALASVEVFTEPLAVVVPDSHPLRAENFTSLAELRDERFVLPALNGTSPHVQALARLFAQYGFQPQLTLTSDFGATVLSLVAAGLGISVLPLSYADSPLRGLRFIELPHRSPVYMVWRRDDPSVVLQHLLAAAQQAVDGQFSKSI